MNAISLKWGVSWPCTGAFCIVYRAPVEIQFVRISGIAKLSRPTGHSLFLNYFQHQFGQVTPHFKYSCNTKTQGTSYRNLLEHIRQSAY